MSWGVRQLKGFVIAESDSAPKLQVQELVLVENLQETADRTVKKATGGTSSNLDLIFSKEQFAEQFSNILNDATELSDSDLEVLLIYLSRDSGSIAYDGKVSWSMAFSSENWLTKRPDYQVQISRGRRGNHAAGHDHCIHQSLGVDHVKTGRNPGGQDY